MDYIVTTYTKHGERENSTLYHNSSDLIKEIAHMESENIKYTIHEANCIVDRS